MKHDAVIYGLIALIMVLLIVIGILTYMQMNQEYEVAPPENSLAIPATLDRFAK